MKLSIVFAFLFVLLPHSLPLLADGPVSTLVGTQAEQQAEIRIRAALRKPMSVDWDKKQLDQALAEIRRVTGIACTLDKASLDEIVVSGETTLSLELANVPAETVLDLTLARIDPTATWTTRGENVVVLTSEAARKNLQTRLYPVEDLVTPRDDRPDFEPLMQLIQGVVAPESWEKEGGESTLKPRPADKALTCAQTRVVHDRIADLLLRLREAQQPGAAAAGRNKKDALLQAALAKRVSVSWKAERLDLVLFNLAEQMGTPLLYCDAISLEAAKVTPATPVTLNADDTPGQVVLEKMLAMLSPELTWSEQGGVLTIVCKEFAVNMMCVRVYPVADILAKKGGDPQLLVQTITRLIEPDSWNENSGMASCEFFARGRVLVCLQTSPLQERVERLLTSIRAGKQPVDDAIAE